MLSLVLALTLTTPIPLRMPTPMDVLAKKTPTPRVAIFVTIHPVLAKCGANEGVVQTQVEVALRRCGFTIDRQDPDAYLNISTLAVESSPTRGFAAAVYLYMDMIATVNDSIQTFRLNDERHVVTGPPGEAGRSLRDALAEQLDDLCNSYLEVREALKQKQ